MPLSISRSEGQAVVVNGPATIVVRRIGRGRILLEIAAPDTTKITRGELIGEPDDDPEDTPLVQGDDIDDEISEGAD